MLWRREWWQGASHENGQRNRRPFCVWWDKNLWRPLCLSEFSSVLALYYPGQSKSKVTDLEREGAQDTLCRMKGIYCAVSWEQSPEIISHQTCSMIESHKSKAQCDDDVCVHVCVSSHWKFGLDSKRKPCLDKRLWEVESKLVQHSLLSLHWTPLPTSTLAKHLVEQS